MGTPANDHWDCHVPTLPPNSTCKALTYSRRWLTSVVKHVTSHPAANPNTVVLDIDDGSTTAIHMINVYHEVPQRGHALHHLMAHEIDDQKPTLLIGDFNTHSPRWSMPGKTLSSWASQLMD